MDTFLLTNPVAKNAIDALQAGDATTWFAQFTPDAELYDDGNTMDFGSFLRKPSAMSALLP